MVSGTGLGQHGDYFNIYKISSIEFVFITISIFIFRLEQTASLMVDNGDVITGTSPGKLRQLNAGAGLFLGRREPK